MLIDSFAEDFSLFNAMYLSDQSKKNFYNVEVEKTLKLKRIGVITLYDLNNFGNRLQNHAIIQCFSILGIKAESVVILRQNRFSSLKDRIKAFVSYATKKKRFYLFWKFTQKFTNPRFFYCRSTVVNKTILGRYDAFSTGSDQVWNSKYLQKSTKDLVLKERLLAFVPGEKRMSFAASFSLEKIPPEDNRIFETELKKFPMLLVREEQGARIIDDLNEGTLKEKVSVILDPTLMLPESYWRSIASQDLHQSEDYILEIFLCPPSKSAREAAKFLQKKLNCKIIDLIGENEISEKAGPLQFIELVSKAKYVCTDSFHAVAFSVIFRKQFLVFERSDHSQKRDSRFETLFNKLNINRAVLPNTFNTEVLKQTLDKPLDYVQIDSLLNNERETSWQKIKKALTQIGLGELNE